MIAGNKNFYEWPGWEDKKKMKCKSKRCKGECALILVEVDGILRYEWECMKCHRTFLANKAKYVPPRKNRKRIKRSKYRLHSTRYPSRVRR